MTLELEPAKSRIPKLRDSGNKKQEATLQLAAPKIYDVLYKHRYRELDGLRGIASLMVCINHAMTMVMVIPAASFGSLIITLAARYVSGGIAVDLFFIMSGFFLAGMIENRRADSPLSRRLPEFYARRFIRLVPPAVAAICVFFAASKLPALLPPSNASFALGYANYLPDIHAITFKDLLLNLALIRHTMNPPLWTIRLELFASSLFPLVILVKNRQNSAGYRLIIFGIFVAIGATVSGQQKLGLDVFHYLYIFYCGALIRDFGATLSRLPPLQQYLLFGIAIIGLMATAYLFPNIAWHPFAFDLAITLFGGLLVAILSFGEILQLRRLMNSRIVQFLGRISYSFYLTNWLSVMLMGSLVIHSTIPANDGVFTAVLVLIPLACACNIVLSTVLHRLVEQPSVGLSRYLGNWSLAYP